MVQKGLTLLVSKCCLSVFLRIRQWLHNFGHYSQYQMASLIIFINVNVVVRVVVRLIAAELTTIIVTWVQLKLNIVIWTIR